MNDTAHYTCDSCGESIQISVDTSAGNHQEYVEDCPVCCHPNVLTIGIEDGEVMHVSSRGE